MDVLVTGGAGYIGSRLVRLLPESERLQVRRVRILDNMLEEKFPSLMDLPEDVEYEFVLGDIRSPEDVGRAMVGMDAVVHLAALCNATLSFERRDATEAINYEGALNVVRAACAEPTVRRFVYASSTSVYGPTEGTVYEHSPCRPVSPYAEFKLKGEEEVLGMFAATDGRISPTVLRLATVYGDAPGLRVHTVVNIFAFRAAVGAPVEVFGDGTQLRPFIHVDDVAAAMVFCLGEPETARRVFNVVGQNASVNDLLELMRPLYPRLCVHHVDKEILNQISYSVDGGQLNALGYATQRTLRDGVEEYARLYGSFTRATAQPVPALA